jgi:hypothetical protein
MGHGGAQVLLVIDDGNEGRDGVTHGAEFTTRRRA